MAKSFLEAFTSGFGKVGSTILAEKKKQDDETEAYIKQHSAQTAMDSQAKKDLLEYEYNMKSKAYTDAIAARNGRIVSGGVPAATVTQANTMFNGSAPDNSSLSELPVTSADDTQNEGTDDADATPTMPILPPQATPTQAPLPATGPATQAPVQPPQPNVAVAPVQVQSPVAQPSTIGTAPTPVASTTDVTQDPRYQTYYEAELASIIDKGKGMISGQQADVMADARARTKLSVERARDGNLKFKQDQAGQDASGNYVSFADQNADTLNTNIKQYNLPSDILSPLMTGKGSIAQANIKAAVAANADYYYGNGKDSYGDKLSTVQNTNDKLTTILGLSKDANTGLFMGPAAVIASNLGSNKDTIVAELNKMAAAVGPSMRPPGSGSSSDPDMKLYLNSIADIQSSKKVNVEQMMNLLNLGKKIEEKLQAGAFLHGKVTLANPAASDKLFDQYWKENTPFIRNSNLMQENTSRVSFEDWLQQRGSTTQDTAPTAGAPKPQLVEKVNNLAAKYPGLN